MSLKVKLLNSSEPKLLCFTLIGFFMINKFCHVENLSEKSGQVFFKFLVELRKEQFDGKRSNSKFPLKITRSIKPNY